MVRTRVGYAGGTKADPTYRRIGDHTETFQVDFDPDVIGLAELLDVFWASHPSTSRQWSTQYAHMAFWSDEPQRAAIESSRARVEEALPEGARVTTYVRPLERFYVAEDYHQKYYLRSDKTLMRDFGAMYPDAAGFRESTAAARANGYLGGGGRASVLLAEIDSYGLSAEGRGELLGRAGMSSSAGCGIQDG